MKDSDISTVLISTSTLYFWLSDCCVPRNLLPARSMEEVWVWINRVLSIPYRIEYRRSSAEDVAGAGWICSASLSSTWELDGLASGRGGEGGASSMAVVFSGALLSRESLVVSIGPGLSGLPGGVSSCCGVATSGAMSKPVRPRRSSTSTLHCPGLSSSGGHVV